MWTRSPWPHSQCFQQTLWPPCQLHSGAQRGPGYQVLMNLRYNQLMSMDHQPAHHLLPKCAISSPHLWSQLPGNGGSGGILTCTSWGCPNPLPFCPRLAKLPPGPTWLVRLFRLASVGRPGLSKVGEAEQTPELEKRPVLLSEKAGNGWSLGMVRAPRPCYGLFHLSAEGPVVSEYL